MAAHCRQPSRRYLGIALYHEHLRNLSWRVCTQTAGSASRNILHDAVTPQERRCSRVLSIRVGPPPSLPLISQFVYSSFSPSHRSRRDSFVRLSGLSHVVSHVVSSSDSSLCSANGEIGMLDSVVSTSASQRVRLLGM